LEAASESNCATWMRSSSEARIEESPGDALLMVITL
jgi:hypothetical protein